VAFVSTNSITQGEQPGVLWPQLFAREVKIHFAHRTFKWSNEGKGIAAVHCVIIGFGANEPKRRTLYEYDRVDGEPRGIDARNINPYLVDASDVVVVKRGFPICSSAPLINYGSMPIDNGHLILSGAEREEALKEEPDLGAFIRPYFGGEEFLNSSRRWCLWLVDAPPNIVRRSAFVRDRLGRVSAFREASDRKETKALAGAPALFGEIRQPKVQYLLIPKVSSESRIYMPMGLMEPDAIASGSCLLIPTATHFHLGVLESSMHMAWMRSVAGRMKSDYQYSARIVYNNFPWPTDKEIGESEIEATAQAILNTRRLYVSASLADLYDRLSMPAELQKAHALNDKAVDAAYGYRGGKDDASRAAFLFGLYARLTALQSGTASKPRKRKATVSSLV
jgi:hypothetical protein